jgi:NAD(P)-dependent dehydrogenase (short-subunit alcohol dehydrogenase family)
MTDDFRGETIWLIGASSGIGAALAVELAARGARLILSARRPDQLAAVRDACARPHDHIVAPLDVGDLAAIDQGVTELRAAVPRVHRVIFLAATYQPGSIIEMTNDDIERVIRVNLSAGFVLARAVTPWLAASGGGQLVLTASVAGYRGLPGGQPYCATKAGLINLAESLRIELAPRGIDMRVINPGFVRTPLTDKNKFHMPMRIEPDAAARAIARGLLARGFEIHFPRAFTVMMKILAMLPYSLYFAVTRRIKP